MLKIICLLSIVSFISGCTFDASKYDNTGSALADQNGAITGANFMNAGNAWGTTAILGTKDAFPLNFKSNDQTWMTLTPTGNFGIGTTLPTQALDVNGQIKSVNLWPASETFLNATWSNYAQGTWQKIATIDSATQYSAVNFFLDIVGTGTWYMGGSATLSILIKNQNINSPFVEFALLDAVAPLSARDFGYTVVGNGLASTVEIYMQIETPGDAYQIQPRNVSINDPTLMTVDFPSNSPALAIPPAGMLAPNANGFYLRPSTFGWFGIGADPYPNPGIHAMSQLNVPNLVSVGTSDSSFAGRLGIGTITPQTAMQVAGVISPATDNAYSLGNATYRFSEVYAANGVVNTSDRREKKDIRDTELGLQFISRLRPVSYHWNNGLDDLKHFGLIAQEAEQAVEDSLPSVLAKKTSIISHDSESDRYGVRYTELISPMIKAIQELRAENDRLKKDNSNLSTRLDEIEKRFPKKTP